MASSPSSSMTAQQQAQQQNMLARRAIQAKAVLMTQQIFGQTVANQAAQPQITVTPRTVGLVLGFWVQVSATITPGAGGTIVATDFGPANIFQNITFTDLENNVRISTTGWHLAMINTLTARRPYGCPLVNGTGIVSVINYGNNFAVDSNTTAPASTPTVWTKWLWIPLAYSQQDLRGAIYLNVVNATAQLVFTINTSPLAVTASGGLDLGYVGIGAGGAGTMTNIVCNVWQVYLDQLPRGQNGGVILPMIDLATVYELKYTQYGVGIAGQDFPIDYPNFRDFLSTVAVYFNGGTGTGGGGGNGRTAGTDVNYWSLQSANFTTIWKMTPSLIALRNRNHMWADLPAGCYYFGSRNKPISTVQYGNMQLNVNPITAGQTSLVFIAYEDFALKNAVSGAGSINAG